jgi:hypothetical protein
MHGRTGGALVDGRIRKEVRQLAQKPPAVGIRPEGAVHDAQPLSRAVRSGVRLARRDPDAVRSQPLQGALAKAPVLVEEEPEAPVEPTRSLLQKKEPDQRRLAGEESPRHRRCGFRGAGTGRPIFLARSRLDLLLRRRVDDPGHGLRRRRPAVHRFPGPRGLLRRSPAGRTSGGGRARLLHRRRVPRRPGGRIAPLAGFAGGAALFLRRTAGVGGGRRIGIGPRFGGGQARGVRLQALGDSLEVKEDQQKRH